MIRPMSAASVRVWGFGLMVSNFAIMIFSIRSGNIEFALLSFNNSLVVLAAAVKLAGSGMRKSAWFLYVMSVIQFNALVFSIINKGGIS